MKLIVTALAVALLCVNSSYGFAPRSGVFRAPTKSSSVSMVATGSNSKPNFFFIPQPTPPERYSSNDWWIALYKTGKSRMLPRVSSHLTFSVAWTSILTVLYEFDILKLPEISPLPWTLLASALSLLLVFRTNSAYDRFWEARKLLGSLVNTSRNIALVGARTCETNWTEAEKLRFCSLVGLFPHVMMLHLSYRDSTERIANQVLVSDEDKDKIFSCVHRPLKVIDLMSECYWPTTARQELLTVVTGELTNILGACERIVRCPVPQIYSKHTGRFLSVFTSTLPFLLLPTAGYYTIPVIAIMCWALFVLDEIGNTIENPFNKDWTQELMNIDSLAVAIQGNIEEVIYNGPAPASREDALSRNTVGVSSRELTSL